MKDGKSIFEQTPPMISVEDATRSSTNINLQNLSINSIFSENAIVETVSTIPTQPQQNALMEEEKTENDKIGNKKKRKETEIFERRIKLLEKANFFLGLNEDYDHFILWFSSNADLMQLINLMENYIDKYQNANLALCQDFARFLKLSKHSVVVFYQKNHPFNSAKFNEFFEKKIVENQVRPFREIYENLKYDAETESRSYLAILIRREEELTNGNSYPAKLKRYYNWKNGEIVKYSENISATLENSVSTIAVSSKISAIDEPSTKKTKRQNVMEKSVGILKTGTCIESFQKEKDHFVFLFKDNKSLQKFEEMQQREFRKTNPRVPFYIKV